MNHNASKDFGDFVNVILISLVLFLSFHSVHRDLSTSYTTHLFCAFVPYEVLRLFRQLKVLSFGEETTELVADNGLSMRPSWYTVSFIFSRWIADLEYRVLGIFVVVLILLVFKRPFAVHHVFKQKTYFFVAGHILVVIHASFAVLTNFFFDKAVDYGSEWMNVVADICFFELAPFKPIAYIIVIIVFGLGLKALRDHKNDLRERFSHSAAKNRRQLISVLIYCTPPNLLNLPSAFPRTFCNLYFTLTGSLSSLQDFCLTVTTVDELLLQYRVIVISICTLCSFAEYRRAIMRILRLSRGSSVSSIVAVTPVG